jgi:hypothetical protein
MSSPAEQEFWPALLEQLESRPVAELAIEYGIQAAEIDAALAQMTGDRPVQQEAWWPEVLREHESGSLRQLARRFGTNPRRIRRGLARAAVRVGGTTVDEAGVPALEAFKDRLGKEPDRTLAAEAGLTVEAIKGERRRLGIDPYRMKPDVEEWGSKPPGKREKPRPRRRWQDAPEPVVIRRAGHGRDGSEEPEQDSSPVVRVIERRSLAAPTGFRAVETSQDVEEPAAPARPRTSGLPTLGSVRAPSARDDDHALGGDHQDGRRRRRLVRPSAANEADDVAPNDGLPRLSRLAPRPPVRIIQHDEADEVDEAYEAYEDVPLLSPRAAEPPSDIDQGPSPVSVAAVEMPPAPPPVTKPAAKKPAAKKPATKKPATKKPATKKPAAKKPAAKKPAPRPAPVGAEPPTPSAATSGTDPTESVEASIAWQVNIPGRRDPVLVVAARKADALDQARQLLKVTSLTGATATRLGELLDEGKGS